MPKEKQANPASSGMRGNVESGHPVFVNLNPSDLHRFNCHPDGMPRDCLGDPIWRRAIRP